LGKEVLATLEGHWDSEVFINDKKTDNSEVFWNPTPDIKQWRLIRHTVKFEEQGDFESEIGKQKVKSGHASYLSLIHSQENGITSLQILDHGTHLMI